MATKDEALKMAIKELSQIALGDTPALKACKEALEQPAQEPVAIVYSMQDGYIGQMVVKDIPHKTKLYTSPPSREFIGLSDDEIEQAILLKNKAGAWWGMCLDIARAIEQALRNKNGY